MLSSLVMQTYKTLLEVALWSFLIIGGLLGAGIGASMGHGIVGFIIGGLFAFFGMAVFLGAALILGEIQKSVQEIQRQMGSASGDPSGWRSGPASAPVASSAPTPSSVAQGTRDITKLGESMIGLRSSSNLDSSNFNGPLGECPVCESHIPLNSQACPKCRVVFGGEGDWRLKPI